MPCSFGFKYNRGGLKAAMRCNAVLRERGGGTAREQFTELGLVRSQTAGRTHSIVLSTKQHSRKNLFPESTFPAHACPLRVAANSHSQTYTDTTACASLLIVFKIKLFLRI